MIAKRRDWIGAFVIAGVGTAASIAFLDRPAARFAHDTWHGAAVFIALTHIVDPVLPMSAIGFLSIGIALLLGWTPPTAVRVVFCLCVASLLAVVIKDQLKYVFGRTWPETWINGNPSFIHDGIVAFSPFHGGQGWASFPSGHMTMVTAPMAVLIIMRRDGWRWLGILPVILVAIGLYGADYHFVGDMIAGVLVGALCAAIAVATVGPSSRLS